MSLVKIKAGRLTPLGLEIEASRMWFAMLVYHKCMYVIYYDLVLMSVLSTVVLVMNFINSRMVQFIKFPDFINLFSSDVVLGILING